MDLLKNLNIDKIRNAAEDALNQAKPKTDVEARIYEALSHKNWGSSSTLMNEIARDSYDYDKFNTITRIIWESIDNPRPAAWRVVFKALTLLEHLIKNGSERCVDDGRNHSHALRGLFNFNYYEGTVDRGQGVREKAKQIVEFVADDERVREERIKAKQLREKFGGNIGGTGNGGGGGSMAGIGGGGSAYAGYGNDNATTGYGNGNGNDNGNGNESGDHGGYGGSGSYGNSGLGASGGYSDSAAATNEGGNNFSGRYSEEAGDAAPTFAALPEKKVKKKKKSKKKKEKAVEPSPTPAAPEIDLLAMDDPSPAANDGFDAFQGAPVADPQVNVFDAFQNAPASTQQPSSDFDAFQSAPTPTPAPAQQQNQFDVFGGSPAPVSNSQTFDAFGNGGGNGMGMGMGGNVNRMQNGFGNMSMGGSNYSNDNNNNMMGMQRQQMMMGGQPNAMGGNNSSVMGGGGGGNNMNSMQQQTNSQNDDDFGAFDDGNARKSSARADPLSNLISLDGLAKNQKKEDKIKEPIVFNDAAKAYIQSGAQHSRPLGTSKMAADMAFSGVDGLHKQTSFNNVNRMGHNLQQSQSVMGGGGTHPMMNSMGSQMGQMQGMMGGIQQQNMGMMNNGMGMGNNMNGGQQMQQGMGGMNNNMMNSGMGMRNNMNNGQQMQQDMGSNNNMMNNGMGGIGNNTMPMGGQPGQQPMGGGWQ